MLPNEGVAIEATLKGIIAMVSRSSAGRRTVTGPNCSAWQHVMTKPEIDTLRDILEVVTALFLEMTVSDTTCIEKRPMLLGMCDLCERSALRGESADAEPARLIRRTVALLRIDLHEQLQEHAECLAAAELGTRVIHDSNSTLFEFLDAT